VIIVYKRLIKLPNLPTRSFFLWVPRQVGKSTLLRLAYPQATEINLLKSDIFAKYRLHPERLREELATAMPGKLIVIDEVQKVPALLDEVHYLIEEHGLVFALCGSSARKLKHGHANLLGGRALRYEMYGLGAMELASDFDLNRLLNRGYIPSHYDCTDSEWPRLMLSYVGDYLKEEIAAEGLVRNLAGFGEFLRMAALSDTETVSFSSFGRDVGVSPNTVKEYFSIMVDTLQGWWLPSYAARPKRRTVSAPKFYFADIGVVNHLARRGHLTAGGELFGKAFENWLGHELRSYNQYRDRFLDLSYWRLSSGIEVDFIVGQIELAVEAKAVTRVRSEHLKGLRELSKEHPGDYQRILVCLESVARTTEDGITVLPYDQFVSKLWSGELF